MLWRSIVWFLILLPYGLVSGQSPVSGQLDLSNHDFSDDPSFSLNGEWLFYPDQFLDPANPQGKDPIIIKVPKRWEQSGLSAMGYGTYSLTIYKNTAIPMALKVPDLFSAYHLYINGELLARMGTPAENAKEEKPDRLHNFVSLAHIQSDTLQMVIHISNFVHSKGGLGSSITFGTLDRLMDKKFINDVYDVFMAGCLIMGAFFFFGLFLYGQHEKMVLYFSLFCLVYAYRIIGWGNYVLYDLVDMPYRLGMTIEYSTFYLTAFFFCLYLKHLFPKDTPIKVANFFIVLSLAWALMTLLPVRIFTQLNDPFLLLLLLGMGFAFFVFIRAIFRRRRGAVFSLYSTMGIIVVFCMKTLAYLNVLEEILWVSMLGQLIFFLFQALILSQHFTESWRRSKQEAENAAKIKSDFLSIMSHEIRTPLNSVIGTTYHLISEKPRKDQLEELNILKNSSEYLLTLINNVLDYSKIDAGKLELELSNVDLKAYCLNVFNVFKPIAEEKKIAFSFQFDDQLPAVVRLDKTRVNQILTNLIGNAIKFTEKGSVNFYVSKGLTEDSKVEVIFKIQDTGIGINNDLMDRIFQSFQQGSTSTTRKYGGTGLGLSITKQLVEQMGSKIHLTSEPGKGSVFYFSLDLEVKKKAERIRQEGVLNLKGYRALLVEDNDMNVLIAKRLLEKWEMEVTVAKNGQEALQIIEEQDFDIVLMDLQMPVMDGYEATRHLRKKGFQSPILALTASAMFEKSTKMSKTGLNGVVTKPFNPHDLYDAISGQLKK
ncbi:ATP-binding protein [Ekhidna sp.]|uniref:ATP-binding protein n=1 Tax=Ekhidna sp. TaxID=2608089 RepID=UPI003C7A4E62